MRKAVPVSLERKSVLYKIHPGTGMQNNTVYQREHNQEWLLDSSSWDQLSQVIRCTLNTSPNWKVKVLPVGPSAKSRVQTLEFLQALQKTGKGGQVIICLVLHKSLAVKAHKKKGKVDSILSSRPEHPFLCRPPLPLGILCKGHKNRWNRTHSLPLFMMDQ